MYSYTDDHLILCYSPTHLHKAINIVKNWSAEYNIKLNPEKSGILEVPPKYHSTSLRVGACIEGIPIVDSYKYLGV